MHIRIDRKPLMQATQRCLNIVDKRVTTPSLSNLLLQADGDRIHIMATNSQLTTQITLHGETIAPGATSVDAKKLHDLLKEWGDVEQIDLMLQNHRLELRSGRSVMRLNTISADAFPSLPQIPLSGLDVRVASVVLSEMIASTQFSISNDATREHLTGLLFELSADHGLRVVSTDGHRLSFCQTPLVPALTIEEPFQVIVPAKTVVEMRRLCDDVDQDIRLILDRDQIFLVAGEQMLTSVLINARYPLYEEVFPQDIPRRTMLPNKEIDTVLRRCLVVANEINHDIRLHFADNAVHISASNQEQEQVDDYVAIHYQDAPFTMGFNGGYLRDVLSVISSDQVEMAFSDEVSPVIFTEHALGIEKRFVVMPLKIG